MGLSNWGDVRLRGDILELGAFEGPPNDGSDKEGLRNSHIKRP